MDLTEARGLIKRLVKERQTLVDIEGVLDIADDAMKKHAGMANNIKSLEKKEGKLITRVDDLTRKSNGLEVTLSALEEGADERTREIADDLETARKAHESVLTGMKRDEVNELARIRLNNRKVVDALNEGRRLAEETLSSVEHELEAVRRKMQGLLNNG